MKQAIVTTIAAILVGVGVVLGVLGSGMLVLHLLYQWWALLDRWLGVVPA